MIERDGYVAVKYFQPIDNRVQVSGGFYVFSVRRNVSMAWVLKHHVQEVLNYTKRCCGGSLNHPYRLANDSDVRIWENTAER